MDEDIFGQLDLLQNGARRLHPKCTDSHEHRICPSPTSPARSEFGGAHSNSIAGPPGVWSPFVEQPPSQQEPLSSDAETAEGHRTSDIHEYIAASAPVRRNVQSPQDLYREADDTRQHVISSLTPDAGYPSWSSAGLDAPIVQGIKLVPTDILPDRFRTIFPFPLFNAVQSKCLESVYRSDDNVVIAAPTGSGKTAVLELAICRLVLSNASVPFKIVYHAPTKALCSERLRDWQSKFAPLNLQCAQLTGDSDSTQLRSVQQATIIITTPEKWDSMTRKWRDHRRLMAMVKLFLIDEVHILKEDRGATLEAVVSRMKSLHTQVRFVALSATVPNLDDIAAWLGRNSTLSNLPAVRERFGEDFRPVRLVKHVVGYQTQSANDFAFEKVLNGKLSEVIDKWSQQKPIMVFCFTRSSCVETAKVLARWWMSLSQEDRKWRAPSQKIDTVNQDLQGLMTAGVAFHHAGLQLQDRHDVEQSYLRGDIGVICCTSTLAIGVNLPCHMVVIKNTVSYQSTAGGCKEYSDLEVMQMLGRAGRPQFDSNGVAVIMTRHHKVDHYEKMVTGRDILESCLHRNLIDHVNSEIGLGTITDIASARSWLADSFLYVRLQKNPNHYRLEGDGDCDNLEQRLDKICTSAVQSLQGTGLVDSTEPLQCTEFGDAMARYYIQFPTMRNFLSLPPKAKVSEILSAVCQADEFREVRFRAGDKPAYKDLNKHGSIKFPIPVNLDSPAHKVSLIIQAVLGGIDMPAMDAKHAADFNIARGLIFQQVGRLIRCIIDCRLALKDAIGARNALMLARSLSAQAWDDSPLHMRQLEFVGIVAVRKLVTSGIHSIEELEVAEVDRIERAMSRHPPYGTQMRARARAFPKLRVSIRAAGRPLVQGLHVILAVRIDMSFLNDNTPEVFRKHPVFVCLLIETSDGRLVDFIRVGAARLKGGHDFPCTVELQCPRQTIRASVMCDQIAGTMRIAILTPEIPPSLFPSRDEQTGAEPQSQQTNVDNPRKRKLVSCTSDTPYSSRNRNLPSAPDYLDLDDADLVAAENKLQAAVVDDLDLAVECDPAKKVKTSKLATGSETSDPVRLSNGKWACNHSCKDKTSCKHFCCREGLDTRPKRPRTTGKKQTLPRPSSTAAQPKLVFAGDKKQRAPGRIVSKAEGTTLAGQTRQTANQQEPDARQLGAPLDGLSPLACKDRPREGRSLFIAQSSTLSHGPKIPQTQYDLRQVSSLNGQIHYDHQSSFADPDDQPGGESSFADPDDQPGGDELFCSLTPAPASSHKELDGDVFGVDTLDLTASVTPNLLTDQKPPGRLAWSSASLFGPAGSSLDCPDRGPKPPLVTSDGPERASETPTHISFFPHRNPRETSSQVGLAEGDSDQPVHPAVGPMEPAALILQSRRFQDDAVSHAAQPDSATPNDLQAWFEDHFGKDMFNFVN